MSVDWNSTFTFLRPCTRAGLLLDPAEAGLWPDV